MQPSSNSCTEGNPPHGDVVDSNTTGRLEAIKWLGLAVMVAEHWYRYVVGQLPQWLYQCGRLAFPLFVIALACGLRHQARDRLASTVMRVLAWAIAAQALLQLVDAPAGRLNVLFTFTAGLALVVVFERAASTFLRALAMAAAGAIGMWCEFGPFGVGLVAAAVALGRAEQPPAVAWIGVLGLLAALAVPNGNAIALAAVPVASAVWLLGLRIPRVRGVFHWAYALQFPVYAAAHQVLT